MKRFWREAAVADGAILLDGRPVRTPGRAPLTLPTPALADAVAAEWQAVGETVDPRAMPLTGLANAALDRIAPAAPRFADDLARYGESDLLCYRAATPDALVAAQRDAWDPWLDWAARRYDVAFETVVGIMHRPQPPATLARLRAAMRACDAFTLAALSPLVTTTGSLVLALALLERAGDADTIWAAAHVDEVWQARQWGEDPAAALALAMRRADYDAGARLLALLA